MVMVMIDHVSSNGTRMSDDNLIKQVSAKGRVEYFTRDGVRHRIGGPAIIAINGSKYWLQNGKYHREDGPAWDLRNGKQVWYIRGKLHREDGPAIIFPDGTMKYYLDNRLHRKDGPAAIYSDGRQVWYYHGRYHRIGGPAIISSPEISLYAQQTKWYRHGKLHRDDGPAWTTRTRTYWFLNGKNLEFKDYWGKVKGGPNATKVMAYILGSKENSEE